MSQDHLPRPGSPATARRNQVSCLPTAASGAAVETNTGDGEATVVARPCPLLPSEPVHPAAAPATTTLSQAHKIRLAVFVPGRLTCTVMRQAARRGYPAVAAAAAEPEPVHLFPPLTVGLARPL